LELDIRKRFLIREQDHDSDSTPLSFLWNLHVSRMYVSAYTFLEKGALFQQRFHSLHAPGEALISCVSAN
jgi:hypothetical protein